MGIRETMHSCCKGFREMTRLQTHGEFEVLADQPKLADVTLAH